MSLSAEQVMQAAALALARYSVVDGGRYAPIDAMRSRKYSDFAGKLEVEYSGRSEAAVFEYALIGLDIADGVVYTCLYNGTEIRITPVEAIYSQTESGVETEDQG